MVTQLANVVELSQAKRLTIGFGFSEGPPWHPEGYGLFVDVRANRTIRMKPPGTRIPRAAEHLPGHSPPSRRVRRGHEVICLGGVGDWSFT
jgi:sugar lactone lactonase YvrE